MAILDDQSLKFLRCQKIDILSKALQLFLIHKSELLSAFDRGELEKDFVAVVRFQGPKANGIARVAQTDATISCASKQRV